MPVSALIVFTQLPTFAIAPASVLSVPVKLLYTQLEIPQKHVLTHVLLFPQITALIRTHTHVSKITVLIPARMITHLQQHSFVFNAPASVRMVLYQGVAFSKVNSTDACVDACKAMPFSSCNRYNTYACLGNDCTYSSEYINSSSTVMGSYRCSCQCPYGSDQGWAYASTNSPEACISACVAVSIKSMR